MKVGLGEWKWDRGYNRTLTNPKGNSGAEKTFQKYPNRDKGAKPLYTPY